MAASNTNAAQITPTTGHSQGGSPLDVEVGVGVGVGMDAGVGVGVGIGVGVVVDVGVGIDVSETLATKASLPPV